MDRDGAAGAGPGGMGCCLLLPGVPGTTGMTSPLVKGQSFSFCSVCCNTGGNLLFVCTQDGYKIALHASTCRASSSLQDVTGPFWGGGTTQREVGNRGNEV